MYSWINFASAAEKFVLSTASQMSFDTTDNLTAVLYKPGDIRLEQRLVPEPDENEVQIRIGAVGIGGSDIHYWKHGGIGNFTVKIPLILGHEATGVVTKVGSKVTQLQVGDRVAIEPRIPCRHCELCKMERYNLCKLIQFGAMPPVDRTLCRFYTHAADFCYKLPDHVTLEEGGLLEPLSVGVQACRHARVRLSSVVLVCGAGSIGLLTLVTAKVKGAAKVVVTDLIASRLVMAKLLGAAGTFQVDRNHTEVEIAQGVEAALGEMPSVTNECTGVEKSFRSAMMGTKSGGCVVLVGLGSSERILPIAKPVVRQVDIRGVFRYANCYPTALEMIASGKFDVKK